LWCTAFIIQRHFSRQERVLFSPVLLLLLVAPIDPHIQTLFSRSLNPEHPPVLFYRSVHEGFSNGIFKNITQKVNEKSSNHLLLLAATNHAIKNGDLARASNYAEMSLRLRPDDPVVLTTSGNVSFFKGDMSHAKKLYQQAIVIDDQSAEAHYNLGQCHLRTFETTEGMEQINQAVALNSAFVNTYIQNNNLYFSDSIPSLRQIMFPDYSPGTFWSKIMFQSVYDGKTAANYWGTSLFGFSPWISFFISLLLLLVYLLLHFLHSEDKVRRLFDCSFCGRKICKKCRSGTLCKACSDATRFVRNEATVEKVRSAINRRSNLTKNISILSINMFFPGAGNLLYNEPFKMGDLLLLLSTSLVFGFYVQSIQKQPFIAIGHPEYVYLLALCLLYSSCFVFTNGFSLFKTVIKHIQTTED
jgi:tetratricopeptide (TPR) repeat protein